MCMSKPLHGKNSLSLTPAAIGNINRVQIARHYWKVVRQAVARFGEIDGEQRAAAFGYYALFSLFPLILLFVTIGSYCVEREASIREITRFIAHYIPVAQQEENLLVSTIDGVLEAREEVGVVALLALVWSALKFLKVLIRATNRAWNSDIYNWWKLPAKSLALLGIVASAALLGILMPAAARILERWLPAIFAHTASIFDFLIALIPTAILFYGLSMVYKLAPSRRTRFSEVWLAAVASTVLFRLAEMLFVWYTRNLTNWNALYGALGGMIAFLVWVYLSGWIVVFGVCLCAAQAETRSSR